MCGAIDSLHSGLHWPSEDQILEVREHPQRKRQVLMGVCQPGYMDGECGGEEGGQSMGCICDSA